MTVELTLLRQKAKIDWWKDADANTTYFHASVKERVVRSRITSICTVDGLTLDQEEEIADDFIGTFKSLFGAADDNLQQVEQSVLEKGPLVSKDQKQVLTKHVTEAEVYEAICSIDFGKAPGPGGFSSGFYKAAWDIIRVDLTKAVQDFFRKGKMLKQVNCTLITFSSQR